MRDTEREAETQAGDVGLDPGSPGSHPGLQAVLNRCATGTARINLKKNQTGFKTKKTAVE